MAYLRAGFENRPPITNDFAARYNFSTGRLDPVVKSGPLKPEDKFRDDLRECLIELDYQGTFFSSQTAQSFINPGLQVKEIGTIGLPLSVRDAQAIAGVCKQSPFGKGAQTVVDETVRQTWELDTHEFTCRNPAWQDYVNTLLKKVVEDLGVQVRCSAEPYKFLLYEEGAFFKAHRDTEKAPGMFGTLVICLPSEHTGGDVVLLHNKKQHTINTESNSAFGMSALAWYSDVQHEIQPVTSGFRLVLTYNLVQDLRLPKQSAQALDVSDAELTTLLRTWRSSYDFTHLVYPLEHRYTEANLSLQCLKGCDAATGRRLEQLCAQNGFFWVLAEMTKSKQEDMDENYGDGYDAEIHLGIPVMPSGQRIHLQLDPLDAGDLLGDIDDLCDKDPDSEDEGEYTGNEGMPSIYHYHYTVAIMIRKDCETIKTLADHRPSAGSLLLFFELLTGNSDFQDEKELSQGMAWMLKKALDVMLPKRAPEVYRQSYINSSHRDPEKIFPASVKVFETISTYCYEHGMANIVHDILHDAVRVAEFADSPELTKLVARHVAKEASEGKENVWGYWLAAPLPQVPTYYFVNGQNQALRAVKNALPAHLVPSFEEWSTPYLDELVRSVKCFSRKEVPPLLTLIPSVLPETYFEVVLKFLVELSCRHAIPCFLHVLGTESKNYALPREQIVKPTYDRMLETPVSSLTLSIEEIIKYARNDSQYNYLYTSPTDAPMSVPEFFGILNESMKLGLKDEASRLLRTGLPNPIRLHSSFWSNWKVMYIFIRDLVKALQTHRDKQLNEVGKPFIVHVLQNSSKFLANSRPQKPQTWSRPHRPRPSYSPAPPKVCNCIPCNNAKSFLINPTQRVGRFSFAVKIRAHIQHECFDHREFKYETDRTRSPHTLVVYKTDNEYTRDLANWHEDVRQMRSKQAEMRTEFLAVGLEGDAVEIAGLNNELMAAGTAEGVQMGPQALQPTSANAQNRAPFAPPKLLMKTDMEVVDLTDD